MRKSLIIGRRVAIGLVGAGLAFGVAAPAQAHPCTFTCDIDKTIFDSAHVRIPADDVINPKGQ